MPQGLLIDIAGDKGASKNGPFVKKLGV